MCTVYCTADTSSQNSSWVYYDAIGNDALAMTHWQRLIGKDVLPMRCCQCVVVHPTRVLYAVPAVRYTQVEFIVYCARTDTQ